VTRIQGQDLVFSTTGKTPVSGFTKSKAALDKGLNVTDRRLHDIRCTGVPALRPSNASPRSGSLSAQATCIQIKHGHIGLAATLESSA
jgi:hypothetical protein